jgi:hypothetical protein
MRRCCRPNLRLALYSLCLCFLRPPATALISIQEEIFSHPFALILTIRTSALRDLMKVWKLFSRSIVTVFRIVQP